MISSRWGHVLAIVAGVFSNIVVAFHEGVTVVSPSGVSGDVRLSV